MIRHLCLLLVAAATSGCHTFRPVEWEGLRPEMQVRARVSAAHADELSEVLPVEGRLLEGWVVENGAQELLLRVPVTNLASAGLSGVLHQQIGLPRDAVLELELKELNRGRTTAMVAAATLLTGVIVYAIVEGTAGGSRPGDPGGPVDARIPVRIFGR